jgi:hypothetical protein
MREISASSFDPRAWNLFTGAVLVSACSQRPLADVTEATATSEDSTENTGTTTDATDTTSDTTDTTSDTTGTETGEGPECTSDNDCGYVSAWCIDGTCVYCLPPGVGCGDHSGCLCVNYTCECPAPCNIYEATYYMTGCGQYELCGPAQIGGSCFPAWDPPLPDCNTNVMGIPTVVEPGALPLALSFVDVDDDGLDELAVATATQLLVYEFGIPDPTVTERAIPSNAVQAMVSAQFDGQAGEDLMLLVDTDVHGYFSDGISAFANPATLPSPIDMPGGLLAGDFDGLAPEDLWIWGPSGARLYLGGIDLSVDIPSPYGVSGVAAFEYPSPYAGILLGGLFDLAGGPLAAAVSLNSVAAVFTPDEGRFVSAGYHSANWSHIRLRDAQTLVETQAGLRAGHPALLAGDFDGDQWQEVLAVDDSVELILGVFDEPCISTLDLGIQPAAILPAVGDHDSNGDDEFAISTVTGEVIIVDVQ